MKIAYISHPVAGDVENNIIKILNIVREINLTEPDIVPFVPYLADIQALDDSNTEERDRGFKNIAQMFRRKSFDELRIYGNKITAGILIEINLSLENRIPVIPKTKKAEEQLKEILS